MGGAGADEAIAPAMPGLDVARGLGIVAQGLADLVDGRLQDAFADVLAGPEGVENFGFGEQPVRVLEQVAQHGEGAWPQDDRLIAAP